MSITRIIPALLLKGNGFIKTSRFKDSVYLGDCFNTVRLFNEKEADELMILDITATFEQRLPRFDFLRDLASECFMPLGYGGGIRSIDDMRILFNAGFEKLSINTQSFKNPGLVKDAAREFGSQSVIASIDFRKKLLGNTEVYINGGREGIGMDPVTAARHAEELGAGEILLNSIDRDGTMQGYDLDVIRKVSDAVTIPVIACGGAGSLIDFRRAIHEGHASAVSAGSYFVFNGKHRAVLITYPAHAITIKEIGKK
jgi:cyclase